MAEETYRVIELGGEVEGGAGIEFLRFEKGMKDMRWRAHAWVVVSIEGIAEEIQLVLWNDYHGWVFMNRGWADVQFIFNDQDKMTVLQRAAPQLGEFLQRHYFLPLEREEALERIGEIERTLDR